MPPATLLRAAVLATVLLAGGPLAAGAQVFLAARPNPEFEIGPLFVRAQVTPEIGDIPVEVFFSIAVLPGKSAVEQDVYLLWPSAIVGDPALGKPDPALPGQVEAQGMTVIEQGRTPLYARNLYERGAGGRTQRETIAGGAPYVSFVREGGAMGLTAPATYLRIPWTARSVNRAYIMNLHLLTRGLVKDKPGTWVERSLWGVRHRLSLSFSDVRQRGMFPMYFWNRDKIVHLSEDPSQLMMHFTQADRLKVDEMFPQSARRMLSETADNTDVISVFLDRAEGLRPQTLTVQFGYFSGLQAWAPVLVPTLFFVLGNIAAVVVRNLAERITRRMSGRFHLGRGARHTPARESGTLIPRETLARVVPGETRYEELRRLIPGHPEEQERLETPGRRTLVYRGRRVVPNRRRIFGWFATVDHWDVEHHEVQVELEGEVVSDVHARLRRTRAKTPAVPA